VTVNISLEKKGEVLLARVDELQIGAEIADEFKTRIREGLPESGGRVAIDLSKVDFMDSSGLGSLVSLLKIVRPEGELCLFGVRPSVQEILRLTHLDAVFGHEKTEDEAMARLTRGLAPEPAPAASEADSDAAPSHPE
jgi:anti-sigma B factor antagonist